MNLSTRDYNQLMARRDPATRTLANAMRPKAQPVARPQSGASLSLWIDMRVVSEGNASNRKHYMDKVNRVKRQRRIVAMHCMGKTLPVLPAKVTLITELTTAGMISPGPTISAWGRLRGMECS